MAPSPNLQSAHHSLRPEHDVNLVQGSTAGDRRHHNHLRRTRRLRSPQPQIPPRRRAYLPQGAHAPTQRVGVSRQAVHPHHHLDIPQVPRLVGRSCYNHWRYSPEEGAWELPDSALVCQLTGRLQDCPEGDDHGARESDALVPLGLDHPIAVYGAQRLEEGEVNVIWGPKILKVLENTPRANKEVSLGESVIQRLSLNMQLRIASLHGLYSVVITMHRHMRCCRRTRHASAEFWTLSS
jgi:hypothetical protein